MFVNKITKIVTSKSFSISRSLVTRTSLRSGSYKADKGDHHDDHAHYSHPVRNKMLNLIFIWLLLLIFYKMFENLPFSKNKMGLMIFGGMFGGVGLILFACDFQQRKHGFKK